MRAEEEGEGTEDRTLEGGGKRGREGTSGAGAGKSEQQIQPPTYIREPGVIWLSSRERVRGNEGEE